MINSQSHRWMIAAIKSLNWAESFFFPVTTYQVGKLCRDESVTGYTGWTVLFSPLTGTTFL